MFDFFNVVPEKTEEKVSSVFSQRRRSPLRSNYFKRGSEDALTESSQCELVGVISYKFCEIQGLPFVPCEILLIVGKEIFPTINRKRLLKHFSDVKYATLNVSALCKGKGRNQKVKLIESVVFTTDSINLFQNCLYDFPSFEVNEVKGSIFTI